MMKKFKFFEGIVHNSFIVDLNHYAVEHGLNVEEELINEMSRNISNAIDEEIMQSLLDITDDNPDIEVEEITRRINSGGEFDYLNRWIRIGENNNRA